MGDDNAHITAALVSLFRREFELCNVKQGETIIAFSNPLSPRNYSAAVFGAAVELGARPFEIVVPMEGSWFETTAVVDAWKAADMVIGLTVPGSDWIYSDAHNQALDTGTRTLMVAEPFDILRRLFPDSAVRSRTAAGQRVLDEGTVLHIMSDAGTDLTLSKDGRPGFGQDGVADTPAVFDQWPSGLVGTAPVESSAQGTLLIDVGDIVLPLGRYVASPIRCTLDEGRIVSIEGGSDATLLRDLLESARDPNAYVVSHVGWGTDHRARWNEVDTRFWEGGGQQDAESYLGNMLIAFGTNAFRGFRGTNRLRFHLDVPTRHHSVWVDNRQVLDRGRFVDSELQ